MPTKPAIGIFFTDDYIQVSQVGSSQKRLVKFNQLPLPTGIVVGGEIKEPAKLSQILIRLLNTTEPDPIPAGSDVVVGVSDNRVFLREFTLPKLSGRDIDEAVDWQVKQLLPVLPGEVETDRLIIGKDRNGFVEVLLAAVPKSIIKPYLDLIRGIGLNIISIEPAVFASLRIINPEQLKGKNILLVLIGEGYTEFIYVTNGNPRFSDFLTDIDIESKGGILASVKEYINFANSKHPERRIQEILVSGYSDNLQDIATKIAEAKLPLKIAVSRIDSADVKNHNFLSISHGLSLKTSVQEFSLNLLPVDFRLETVKLKMAKTWKMMLSVLVTMSVLILIGLAYFWQSSTSRLRILDNLKRQYQSELTSSPSGELISQVDQINQVTDRLILLRSASGGEDGLMRELQNTTPEGIVLTSFIYSRAQGGGALVSKGSSWIITGNANSRQQVLDFYESLLRFPEFSNGRLYFGSLEKETGIIFRIASQIIK